MVSTPSPSAVDDRRRRSMMDKARATHLSRQLQLRLQYARLKVEHGWHKQNLNEVENLYFHHSHQRGPRSYPAGSMATTTQSEFPVSRTGIPPPLPPQSSLSFKIGSSSSFNKSLSGVESAASDVRMDETPSMNSATNVQVAAPPPSTSTSQSTLSPNEQSQPSLLSPTDATASRKDAAQNVTQHSGPSNFENAPPSPPVQYSTTYWGSKPGASAQPASSNSLPVTSFPPTMQLSSRAQQKQPAITLSTQQFMTTSQPRSSMMNVMPAYPASVSNPSTQPTTSTSNLPNDPFGSPSSTTLTYDSFWSSHSSTKRPISFRASLSSLATSSLKSGTSNGLSGVAGTGATGISAMASTNVASGLSTPGILRRGSDSIIGYNSLGPPFEPSLSSTTGYKLGAISTSVPGVGGANHVSGLTTTPTTAPATGVSSHA